MKTSGTITNVSFLDANAHRKYPFHDNASMAQSGSGIAMPDAVVLDANFSLPGSDAGIVFLSAWALGPTGGFFEFSGPLGVIGRILVPSTHVDGDSYSLVRSSADAHPMASGTLTVGRLGESAGGGTITDPTAGMLLPSRVSFVPVGLQGLSVETSNGPVVLAGIVLVKESSTVKAVVADNRLEFSAVYAGTDLLDPVPQLEECACETGGQRALPPPVRSINGVVPVNGNIDIVPGSACLSVVPGAGEVTLKDECSEPCCRDEELFEMLRTINDIAVSSRQHSVVLTQAENAITQLSSLYHILLSKV